MKNPIYQDATKSIAERVSDLLSQMTLDEKIAQLGSVWSHEVLEKQSFSKKKADLIIKNGVGQITRIGGATTLSPVKAAEVANSIQRYSLENSRLGIPAIMHEECCSGLMTRNASLFPQALGIAATWNADLVRQMTALIKNQMNGIGAQQGLAPVLDVTRDPRWGRTEETFGEDPYLTAYLGCAYIRGLQEDEQGNISAIATAKHFVGYGAGEGGKNWAPTNISERELHETYLFPFEAAVKEGKLQSVMNSYSEIDGQPCCSSETLLRHILREAWKFEGIVVSDYFSIDMLTEYHKSAANKAEAAVQAIQAGIDMELPSSDCYGSPLKDALEKNLASEQQIDELVKRILRVKFMLGLFENPYVETRASEIAFRKDVAKDLSKTLATQSLVLLQNDGTLPLSGTLKSIAVVGPNADNWRNMIGDYAYPCHIESLIEMKEKENTFNTPIPEDVGDISGALNVVTIFEALKQQLAPNVTVTHAEGCKVNDQSRSGIANAVDIVNQAELAVVVLGDKTGLTDDCTSGEGRDSATLRLPGMQEELLQAVIKTGKPLVLVLVAGRTYQITDYLNKINAIIFAGFPGEEGGNAIAEVLSGMSNPSGKLPISYPRSVGQIPVFYSHKPSGGRSHWKGSYTDESEKPLYPFGHGLSYAAFDYRQLELDKKELQPDEPVQVSFTVTNTSDISGYEVAQLYLRYQPQGIKITRPVKELKGFCRVSLKPAETKAITFTVFPTQLAYYAKNLEYALAPGMVSIMIGSSSQDIHLEGEFKISCPGEQMVPNRAFFSLVEIR